MIRWRLLFQSLAIKVIDPLFQNRHPGRLLTAVIRGMGPLLRNLQPNDRWSLPAFVADWASIINQPSPPLQGSAKTIFIFTCYRGQFTLDLIVALLLAWRGHRVVLGYFPKLRSPIKEPLQESPGAQAYLHRILDPIEALTGGRVCCVDLTEHVGRAPIRDMAFLARQVRSDVILKVHKERLDLADPEVSFAFEYYKQVATKAQSAAWSWFETTPRHFDLCLIANGASFEAAQFLHVAKAKAIPVTTFEKFAFSRARTITHGAAFFNFDDLDVLLADGASIGLDQSDIRRELINRAWYLLNQRRKSSGSAWGWQYQKSTRSLREDELLQCLNIKRNGFALVCPNVPFDAGYDGWLAIFPSMRDWLTQTVEYLLRHTDMQVVVRAHPAECRPTFDREKVIDVLAEAGIASPNLVIIPGDSDINTYDLMPFCAFAAVFASTTGVEITMHEKPVIAGASVYYSRCGLTVPVADADTYFQQLDRLIAGEQFDCKRKAEDAAIIYALFHYYLQWPYPYDKPSQVAALPPKSLSQSPRVADYIRTLDSLAMTQSEFREALPELIDLSKDYWT